MNASLSADAYTVGTVCKVRTVMQRADSQRAARICLCGVCGSSGLATEHKEARIDFFFFLDGGDCENRFRSTTIEDEAGFVVNIVPRWRK